MGEAAPRAGTWRLHPPRLAHVDPHVVVAIKPAGQLCVPGRAADPRDCLYAQVHDVHEDALVVHRLDMATSGLLMFARGAPAQRALGTAFAQQRIEKRYVAVGDGCVADDDGVIDLPLAADWPNRPKQRVSTADGKPSLTSYRVLSRDPARGTSRLELRPRTGRSHQLRVHLMAIGHPILGDRLYAPDPVVARAPRLLLHASRLTFEHPATHGCMELADEPPF